MNVDELLDLMEETLEEGTAIPFSSGKRAVDVDKMRDIIDDVRSNLPDEMRQSKKIVEEREQIIADAQHEADGLIKQAEERCKALVSEQEIVKRAQKRAMEILTASQNQAREISKRTTVYCEGLLKNSEEAITRSLADIKNTRMNLRTAPSRGQRSVSGATTSTLGNLSNTGGLSNTGAASAAPPAAPGPAKGGRFGGNYGKR